MSGRTYKRKRGYSHEATMLVAARPAYGKMGPQRKKKRTGPGYTRTSGYYGRFQASGDELKFYEQTFSDGAIAAIGDILSSGSLVNIEQGNKENDRIGRKCTIESMHFRFTIAVPFLDAQATPPAGEAVRFIIYQDKQTNGATAAVTDILENGEFHSFRNLANSQRFIIHMDKVVTFNYTSLASDGAGVVSACGINKNFQINKKCNIPLEFNGITGAITELRSNNIGILVLSRAGAPSIGGTARFRFKG